MISETSISELNAITKRLITSSVSHYRAAVKEFETVSKKCEHQKFPKSAFSICGHSANSKFIIYCNINCCPLR